MDLKIKSVIGLSGNVQNSIYNTPCGKYIIYPLGSFIVIKNVKTEREAFLDGHSHEISCLAMTKNGKRLASGQKQLHGVKADVIIWDLQYAIKLLDEGNTMIGTKCLLHELHQHVGLVQSVSFSCESTYLATLGGQDDNALVIWNVETGVPICGYPAGTDSGLVCMWLHRNNDRLITIGYYHIRVWEIDVSAPKIHPVDVKVGSLRRVFSSIDITPDDEHAYCGTTTGDVVKIKIDRESIHMNNNDANTIIPLVLGVSKDKLSLGIQALKCIQNPSTGNYNVVIGGGDGTITYMNPTLGMVKKLTNTLKGGITSIYEHPMNGKLAVGTNQSNRYEISRDLLEAILKSSCHYSPVNDVCYPDGCPDIVVTSSYGDIRLWNIQKHQELLRIQVPNLDCLCTVVSKSGSLLLSGWEDGKIRAFLPESGKLKFTINDAHDKVTSIAVIDSDIQATTWRIITGGIEGKVRIWNVTNTHQILVSSLKEHRGAVNALKVTPDHQKCVSASSNGSCIVWDLTRYVRIRAFFENNMFRSIVIHPDESQYMTCGSNHKLTYWDAVDGQPIRVLDAGDGVMTSVDIDPLDGEYVVTGCEDKILKLWHYDEGEVLAIGRGHSGIINKVKISPDLKSIISVGSTGEIIHWELPNLNQLRAGEYKNHK